MCALVVGVCVMVCMVDDVVCVCVGEFVGVCKC